MANPEQKLTVVKDGVAQLCQLYEDEHYGTPNDGKALRVNYDGKDCFIGLRPVNKVDRYFDTDLKALVDDAEYYVQTKVVRYVNITVPKVEHQTIKLTYVAYPTEEKITVPLTERTTVKAVEDTNYSILLEADEDYVAGEATPAYGIAKRDIEIVITEAVEDKKTITIKQTNGQTITVFVDGTGYTETVRVPKGSKFTATVTPAQGYRAGKLSTTSGTVNDNITISATAAVAYNTLTVASNTMVDITVKYVSSAGVTKTETVTANSTSLTVDAKPKSSVTIEAGEVAGFVFKEYQIVAGSTKQLSSNPCQFTLEGNTSVDCVMKPAENGIGFAMARRVDGTDNVNFATRPIAAAGNPAVGGAEITEFAHFPTALTGETSSAANKGTVEFTVPDGCTKMLMMFTWDDSSDEHGHIEGLTVVNTKTGQQLWTGRNNAYEYTYSSTYRVVTKGTVVGGIKAGETYKLDVAFGTGAYKARNYGINFIFGDKVEAMAANVNMSSSLAYYNAKITCKAGTVKVVWGPFPYGGTAADIDKTDNATVKVPAGAGYTITAVEPKAGWEISDGSITGSVNGNITINADSLFTWYVPEGDLDNGDAGGGN